MSCSGRLDTSWLPSFSAAASMVLVGRARPELTPIPGNMVSDTVSSVLYAVLLISAESTVRTEHSQIITHFTSARAVYLHQCPCSVSTLYSMLHTPMQIFMHSRVKTNEAYPIQESHSHTCTRCLADDLDNKEGGSLTTQNNMCLVVRASTSDCASLCYEHHRNGDQ